MGIRLGSSLGQPLRRASSAGRAAHEAAALAARLRYTEVGPDFIDGLHGYLDALEAACNQLGDAIAAEYFWSRTPLRRGA